uniref:Major capsid protein n=2 Tax=Trichostrongylidae TaxID=6315 RepID=A0A7I4YY02_HAECO
MIVAMPSLLPVLIGMISVDRVYSDVMQMVDSQWMDRYVPRQYNKLHEDSSGEADVSKDNNYGYSEQGMKDLDEVGGLVGGGDSELLGILRPYYSMVDMSANGNKQGMGSYLHVLPDSKEGDEPIYTLGASFYGGLEPAGAKMGYMTRPFG